MKSYHLCAGTLVPGNLSAQTGSLVAGIAGYEK
jgi:hypothetical protein